MKYYFLGIGWFIISLFCSTANDVISKYATTNLHSFEVSFFRSLFGTLTLIPFILINGKETLKTSNVFIHFIRGFLLFLGLTGWTYGLSIAHVSTGTVISFSIPIFVLVLANFFLEEKVIWQRWLVTLIGFIGIVVTLNPTDTEAFDPQVLIFVFAALSFASLDVINKKFVVKESMTAMLFYSAAITTVLSIPTALYYWETPTIHDLILLLVLGGSSNLILYFILKAFALVDATAVAPYRYLELLISSVTSYVVFSTLPPKSTWYGAVILIPATLFIIYSENKAMKKST